MSRGGPVKRIAIAVVSVVSACLSIAVGAQSAGATTEGVTWAHAAQRWPVVYVENHTDGRWSVATSVRAWGSGLRVGACRSGAGCIRITSPERGLRAPMGQTLVYATGSRITRVTIEMNASDEAQPAAVRKVAAAHELGHALGLGHDRSYHGVMGPVAYGYDHINRYAREELAGLYGV
jgi:hypothetical protein